MKKLLTVLALSPLAFAQAQNPTRYAETIKAEDLKKHLTYLASDELEGRGTGTPGQRKAAEYITNHFKSLGLKGIGPNGSYLQPVELVELGWGEVYVKTASGKKEFLQDFYITGSGNIAQETTLDLVLVGYGIDDEKYSDLKGLDLTGKAVVLLPGEPKNTDGTYVISGTTEASAWSKNPEGMRKKLALLKEKGARCVITIPSVPDEQTDKIYGRMRAYAPRNNRLTFKDEQRPGSTLMTIQIKQALAHEIMGLNEEQLSGLLAGQMKPGDLHNTITLKAEEKQTPIETSNVVGFLEGTDKKNEVLIITAHYDHIGISPDGQINNGANDDGSGTVSVMELAEAFAKAKKDGKGPRRSILFMTVTGEEKGLLGSQYYVNHPLLPLENTVADLNIDMVGRIDKAHEGKPDYIYIIGSDKLSSELHAINEEANQKYTKLDLDYTFNDPNDVNRFYYRSDHYNFAAKKIPIIFYFNGVHDDYHRPTDDVEKIQFDKAEKTDRLVFYTAWELANREKRIVVDSNKP
ncbi:MAG: M28 family peptidase [Siphonobacter sp.]